MPNTHLHRSVVAVIGIAVAIPAYGQQQDTASMPERAESAVSAPVLVAAEAKEVKALPQRLRDDELDSTRGRSTIVINQQQIEGVVSDNNLGDYTAGTIALSDNALSNFSGVGNFLFNTGAQNNLQAGMTLTITIEN